MATGVGLSLGLVAGCGSEAPDPVVHHSDTTVDASCPADLCSPYACDERYGHCYTVCKTSAECAAGFVCDGMACVGTECTAETAAELCGGYSCVGGKCSHDCTSATCLDGFYCRGDTKQCVHRCTSTDDARCGGYVCDVEVGECEPICYLGEIECATGYECSAAMTCEPRPGG